MFPAFRARIEQMLREGYSMQKITQEDRLLEQKWTSLAQEFKTRKFVNPTAPIPLSAPLSDNDSDVEECMSQHQV
jgi:hypothetical protein